MQLETLFKHYELGACESKSYYPNFFFKKSWEVSLFYLRFRSNGGALRRKKFGDEFCSNSRHLHVAASCSTSCGSLMKPKVELSDELCKFC